MALFKIHIVKEQIREYQVNVPGLPRVSDRFTAVYDVVSQPGDELRSLVNRIVCAERMLTYARYKFTHAVAVEVTAGQPVVAGSGVHLFLTFDNADVHPDLSLPGLRNLQPPARRGYDRWLGLYLVRDRDAGRQFHRFQPGCVCPHDLSLISASKRPLASPLVRQDGPLLSFWARWFNYVLGDSPAIDAGAISTTGEVVEVNGELSQYKPAHVGYLLQQKLRSRRVRTFDAQLRQTLWEQAYESRRLLSIYDRAMNTFDHRWGDGHQPERNLITIWAVIGGMVDAVRIWYRVAKYLGYSIPEPLQQSQFDLRLNVAAGARSRIRKPETARLVESCIKRLWQAQRYYETELIYSNLTNFAYSVPVREALYGMRSKQDPEYLRLTRKVREAGLTVTLGFNIRLAARLTYEAWDGINAFLHDAAQTLNLLAVICITDSAPPARGSKRVQGWNDYSFRPTIPTPADYQFSTSWPDLREVPIWKREPFLTLQPNEVVLWTPPTPPPPHEFIWDNTIHPNEDEEEIESLVGTNKTRADQRARDDYDNILTLREDRTPGIEVRWNRHLEPDGSGSGPGRGS